jgi:hypothetical protein
MLLLQKEEFKSWKISPRRKHSRDGTTVQAGCVSHVEWAVLDGKIRHAPEPLYRPQRPYSNKNCIIPI